MKAIMLYEVVLTVVLSVDESPMCNNTAGSYGTLFKGLYVISIVIIMIPTLKPLGKPMCLTGHTYTAHKWEHHPRIHAVL